MNKIAIITASYNTEPELLHNHFFSVAKQGKNLDFVHIIVDDCSTDIASREALFVCANQRKENTILIAKKENGGPGAARNRAIELIEKMGDVKYICLLDADDYLEPDSLYVRAALLEADKDIIATYGNKYTATIKEKFDDLDQRLHLEEISKTLEKVPAFDRNKLMRECYIPSCSVMFRAKPFLEHIQTFREDVRLCEDWLVWRKLALLGDFKKIEIPIYTQTLHGKNLTQTPEVLRNHFRDMIITSNDLSIWCQANKGLIND